MKTESTSGNFHKRLIPAPLGVFLEATGQVFRGDSGTDRFKSNKRGDLSSVGHLRGYKDISETTNIDLVLLFIWT